MRIKKFKKILSLALVITIIFSLFATNVSLPVSATGTNYYVDSVNGSDNNDGRSISTPIKSLSKLQDPLFYFSPGDKINLKRGSVWNENFQLRGSGTASNPCAVTPYGTGAKPKIRGEGVAICDRVVFGGENLSYWNIDNIEVEIVNTNGLTAKIYTSVGIQFSYTTFNHYNINIESCDVYGSGVNTDTYGIRIISVSDGDYSNFLNGLNVKYCNVYNVGWGGIMVATWNYAAYNGNGYGRNMFTQSAYYNTYLTGNAVHNTGVHGATFMGCYLGEIKSNTVYSCGTYTGTGQEWGAAGIMAVECVFVRIDNNWVYSQSDSNNGYDASGIDIDWGCNYVYVHDNYVNSNKGPGIETMANDNCKIYNNQIWDNQCLTTVGNGQISVSDYTNDYSITGVKNIEIYSNSIYGFRQNTVALSTHRFTSGEWQNNKFYYNTISFDTNAINTGVYLFDPYVSYQPFYQCDYNYIYGSPQLFFGCYNNIESASTKALWSSMTLRRGGIAYDIHTTLN